MCLLFSAIGLYSHVLVSSQEQWQYLDTSYEQSGVDILHMIKGNLLNALDSGKCTIVNGGHFSYVHVKIFKV